MAWRKADYSQAIEAMQVLERKAASGAGVNLAVT